MLERQIIALPGSDALAKQSKHRDGSSSSKPQPFLASKNVVSKLKSSARQNRTSSLVSAKLVAFQGTKQTKVDSALDAQEAPNSVLISSLNSENSKILPKEAMSNLGDMETQSRKFDTATDVNQTLNQTFLFCETEMSEGLKISDTISDADGPIISITENTTDFKETFCGKNIDCLPPLNDNKFEVNGTDVTRNSGSDDNLNPLYHFKSFEPAPCEDSFEFSKPNAAATSTSLTEPPGDTKLEDNKGKDEDEVDGYESVPEVAVAPILLGSVSETSISHQTIVLLISLGFLVSLFVAAISPITTLGFYAGPPPT